CGDIQATAAMMNRLLAGRELGPRLLVPGVLDQAATVRRRWLPRLAQLFMSVPHATTRYLNLLAFYARVAPQEINAWRATLDQAAASRLTAVLDASADWRPPRRRPNPWSMLLAVLVSGGALAASGWLIFGAPSAPGAIGVPGSPAALAVLGASGGTAAASPSAPADTASAAGPGNTPAPGKSGSPSGQAPTGAPTAAASHQLP